MTAQFPELILIDGKSYGFGDEKLPLDQLLEQRSIRLAATFSACWRGYRGSWHLDNSRLHLLGFHGFGVGFDGAGHVLKEDNAREGGTGREVSMETLFPSQSPPIFASWWSGDITCHFGELLSYHHIGFASIYEFERKLTFAAGILVADETIRHTKEELEEAARTAASKRSFWSRLRMVLRR